MANLTAKEREILEKLTGGMTLTHSRGFGTSIRPWTRLEDGTEVKNQTFNGLLDKGYLDQIRWDGETRMRMIIGISKKGRELIEGIPTVVVTDDWAGINRIPCRIVGETKTRYRVKFEQDVKIPPQRHVKAGEVVLVPKHAVRKV